MRTHRVVGGSVLGPPNTERTFQPGDEVGPEDFARCPAMWETLIRRGALERVRPDPAPEPPPAPEPAAEPAPRPRRKRK